MRRSGEGYCLGPPLEIVHVVFLGVWNSEIFTAISGLAGLVVGTLIGAKA